jgi:hypothetical protein
MIYKPEELTAAITDPTKKVLDFHMPSDNLIMLDWEYNTQFVPENNSTNIFVAIFTTVAARLKLFEAMDVVQTRCLYHDTDSLIYISKPGLPDLQLGDYLGELTSELEDGDYINKFASTGPKSYSYITAKGKTCCKVRGFSLNYNNSKLVNFEALRDVILTDRKKTIATTNLKIRRRKLDHTLTSAPETKQFRFVYTKRAIQPDLTTLPYGF